MIDPKNVIILLDPGHGSNTPGKCSPDKSVYEWKWVREEAALIQVQLKALGFDARILVPEEKDIPLSTRVARANKIWEENGKNKKGKYVFLISIHLNAAGNGQWMSACGWTGWVATNAGQASRKFAQLLYCEAEKLGLKGNRSVPKEKYWSANFYILKNTKCPAVLTENMFQDNKEDVKFLLSKDGIDKLAKVHVEGIRTFTNGL